MSVQQELASQAPDLAAFEIFRLALQALFMIDKLAVIADDAPVLVDAPEGEEAPAIRS